MKLKLDENLGRNCARLFEAAGHDTSTVHGQNLCGATDTEVIGRCSDEARARVTLDLDFSNPLRFKPSAYCGIVVLRPRSPASLRELEELCRTVIGGMAKEEAGRQTVDCGNWPYPNLSRRAVTIGNRRGV